MSQVEKPKSENQSDWGTALKIFINLSVWIAFPVIIGTFLGRWLDRKYHTDPWLFLTTLGVCFLVSMYGLITKAVKEFKKIDQEYQAKKKMEAKPITGASENDKENSVENK